MEIKSFLIYFRHFFKFRIVDIIDSISKFYEHIIWFSVSFEHEWQTTQTSLGKFAVSHWGEIINKCWNITPKLSS